MTNDDELAKVLTEEERRTVESWQIWRMTCGGARVIDALALNQLLPIIERLAGEVARHMPKPAIECDHDFLPLPSKAQQCGRCGVVDISADLVRG